MTQQETSEFVNSLRRAFQALEVRVGSTSCMCFSIPSYPFCPRFSMAMHGHGQWPVHCGCGRLFLCQLLQWWTGLRWEGAQSWHLPATCGSAVSNIYTLHTRHNPPVTWSRIWGR